MEQTEVKVYGDWFDPDTRTIMVLLRIAGVECNFTEIDQLQNQHKQNDYLDINPIGQVPTLVEGHDKVFGATKVFISYLCNSKDSLAHIYPQEQKAQLDQYMNWFESVLRPSARRVI